MPFADFVLLAILAGNLKKNMDILREKNVCNNEKRLRNIWGPHVVVCAKKGDCGTGVN